MLKYYLLWQTNRLDNAMAGGKEFWAFLLLVMKERNSKLKDTQEEVTFTASLCHKLFLGFTAAVWWQRVNVPALSPVTPAAHVKGLSPGELPSYPWSPRLLSGAGDDWIQRLENSMPEPGMVRLSLKSVSLEKKWAA